MIFLPKSERYLGKHQDSIGKNPNFGPIKSSVSALLTNFLADEIKSSAETGPIWKESSAVLWFSTEMT